LCVIFMRHSLLFITIILNLYSCAQQVDSNFKFGRKYNSIRHKFGAPLIKNNMEAHDCCGNWTTYMVKEQPTDKNPYHYCKAISTIINDTVIEENDVYRRNIDDTTMMQLDIHILYDWKTKSLILIAPGVGKVEKRQIGLKAEDYLKPNLPQFKESQWQTLDNLTQVDSVLTSWGLSRFDKE
jgi:hypothetical protein